MLKSYATNFALAILQGISLICELIEIYKTSQLIEGYYMRVQSWISVMVSGALFLFFLGCGIYSYRQYLKPASPEA